MSRSRSNTILCVWPYGRFVHRLRGFGVCLCTPSGGFAAGAGANLSYKR